MLKLPSAQTSKGNKEHLPDFVGYMMASGLKPTTLMKIKQKKVFIWSYVYYWFYVYIVYIYKHIYILFPFFTLSHLIDSVSNLFQHYFGILQNDKVL